jgi:heme exporter protein C
MRQNLLYSAVCGSIAASYLAFVFAPPEATMGDLYRILYIHLPSAWVCYLAFILSMVTSVLYLQRRDLHYDTLAEASAVLGLVFGAVTLVTGSIWAEAAWGTYWNWDPRETTTLVLWVAYLGYVTLKLSLENEERRAVVGSVYNILAFVTVPLSYFSLQLLPTLHPQVVSGSGIALTPPMILALVLNVVSATVLFAYLLGAASTVKALERRVEALQYVREEGG